MFIIYRRLFMDSLICSMIYLDILLLIPHYLDYCVCVCVCALVIQSCPTLCNPMDHSLPGFSLHGIFQARILEWIAISSLGDLFNPRICTSCISCIGRWILYPCTTREAQNSTDTLWHVKENPVQNSRHQLNINRLVGKSCGPRRVHWTFLILMPLRGY